MKERKRRQSLGGAVLIMVLTVMFILMILLMAALTTVSTANQRIFTKFEESQAYYTARSALDVFTQNMMADANYISTIDYKYTKADGSSDTVKMKQGLGLQMDLYMLKAQEGYHNIKQSELESFVNNTSDTNLKKEEYKKWFGTDSTKVQNNGKTATDPNYKEYVEYEVELPQLANSGSQYGKLSDRVSGVSKAKIKVEVLDRTYDIGSYAMAPSYSNDVDKFFETATANEKAEAIINGNRKKDRLRVKITATTTYDGVEGTAVLILDSNEPPVNNSSRAITAFGGTGSDNMSILGGMAAEGNIDWGTNLGFIYGSVYTEGDFNCKNGGPDIHVNSGESVYIGGNLELGNDHFKVINDTAPLLIDDKDAPFVYVNGDITIHGGLNADPFQNVDIITNAFNVNGKYVVDASTTIYCTSFTSHCGSNSSYNGEIYVDGDVTIVNDNDTKITYDGDGNPTVVHGGTGTIHFTGKVIDGNSGANFGKDVTSGASTGFVKETTGFKSNLPTKETVSKPGDFADGKSDAAIEIQLPNRTEKKRLETHPDNYNNYYVKDADGKIEMSGSPAVPTKKSAQTMADISTMGDKTKPFTSADTGINDKLSDKYSGGSDYGLSFKRVIDTGGTDVNCIWDEAGANDTSIRIKGGGTVTLQLRSGSYNNGFILVDDDTTLKIVGDVDATGSGNDFAKLQVYNQTTYGAIKGTNVGKGTDSLKVGSKAGVGITVPKIYYYFTGGEFSVQTDCLLTGYIYAPDTIVNFPAASNNHISGMQYNGTTITDNNVRVCVIGSALVKGAKIPNMQGVAYINPDLDDDTPGEPIHQWKSFQYIRV